MTDRRLRIGLDARAASHPQAGGFKTYVSNLVTALASVDLDNTYRLYVDRPALAGVSQANPHFQTRLIPSQPPLAGPVLREQVLLPATAKVEQLDVLHLPEGTGSIWPTVPRVVTIHDALEHMPALGGSGVRTTAKRRLMHLYNRHSQRLIARQADAVITVSEHSRRDLVKFLGIDERRIRVIPQAPGPAFRPLDKAQAPIREPYILAIGSADPRKNLASLVRAYAALPAKLVGQYRLAVVWTHGALREDFRRITIQTGMAERIDSLEAPLDEDLCQLMNGAEVFVFPSLYEGFGLPPLEAMACGTPVIATNGSSLPEVLGNAAVLVDPNSATELSSAIARVLQDPALRARMARHGLERASLYSWERTARLTTAVYEAVGGRARPGVLVRPIAS